MTSSTGIQGRPKRRRPFLALGLLFLAGVGGALFGLHWWARHQLRTAEDLVADLRFEDAGRLLDAYLRVRPSDAAARLLAAQAKRRAGDAEAAEHHLDEFDRLQGPTPASALERDLLLAERGALGDKEFELRSRLGRGGADRVLVLEALARDYLTSGRLDEALTCVAELLEERPRHPRALVWRARIRGGLGKWDDALDDARRAVGLLPDSQEARLVWAEVNEHLGRTDVAVREYDRLYEREPTNAAVVLGLGRCRQDQARFAEARQVLDAFLTGQRARADVLVERGRLALREGGTGPAEPFFRRAAAADPNSLDAHRLLLRCLGDGGGIEESARVRSRLRELEIRAGRIDQLLTEVWAAPGETEPRYRLASYLLQNGREDEGRNWLYGVLHLNSGHGPARAALAESSRRAGRGAGQGGRP